MQATEWISLLKNSAKEGDFSLSQLPLGRSGEGRVLLAHDQDRGDRYYHTCVTGGEKTQFILNTVASLLSAYGEELSVLVLSPKSEYANLLRIKGADVTVPYLRTEKQFSAMRELALAQANARKQNPRSSRFLLVLDGLEELPFLPKNNDFGYLRKWIEEMAGGGQVVSGVHFQGSIFAGFEGAFVGVGNSLVWADGKGKADVTKVLADCSLGQPQPIEYAVHF